MDSDVRSRKIGLSTTSTQLRSQHAFLSYNTTNIITSHIIQSTQQIKERNSIYGICCQYSRFCDVTKRERAGESPNWEVGHCYARDTRCSLRNV